MDLELFENGEDDDLLTQAYDDATQIHNLSKTQTIGVVPVFNCNGDDSFKLEFSIEGFVRNGFLNYDEVEFKAVEALTLSVYEYVAEQLDTTLVMEYLCGEACKSIQYLLCSARGDRDDLPNTIGNFWQERYKVTKFYHVLLASTDESRWPLRAMAIKRIRELLNTCIDMKIWKQIYTAKSYRGNESSVVIYHLLHGVLEWRLLDLYLIQKCEQKEKTESSGDDSCDSVDNLFEAQCQRVIEELVLCSAYQYSQKCITDLCFNTPFPCTCFKELWLLLQHLINKRAQKMKAEAQTFWSFYNKIMEQFETNEYMSALNYYQFANWVTQALARLQKYEQNSIPEDQYNYGFCEANTQQFLKLNPNEEQLRVYIHVLMPLGLQYWTTRANFVMLLWEHFHKRLNSTFYLNGAAPKTLAVICKSGYAYLEKYRGLLAKEQQDMTNCSYTLFIVFLGKTLQILKTTSNGRNQTAKLLGRIYAKFCLNKFLTLNVLGVHHLIELFVMLCLCGDAKETLTFLSEQLLSMEYKKLTAPIQSAVAKGHMAILILCAEQNLDMSVYIKKLLEQLAQVNYSIPLCMIYADSLADVFKYAEDSGENNFIDFWLTKLLENSDGAVQSDAYQAVHLIFEKLKERRTNEIEFAMNTTNTLILTALDKHVLPVLRRHLKIGYSPWLPQLAVDFCLHANGEEAFQQLFTYFCNVKCVNQETQPQILLQLLQSKRKAWLDQTLIIKIWLKSLVLLTAKHKSVDALTPHVAELTDFQFITNPLTKEELLTSKEPLRTFIVAVGQRYENCVSERPRISEKFHAYVKDIEQWPDLDQNLRFYIFVAIVLYNCATLTYVKTNPNCFYQLAMRHFILPAKLQAGKAIEGELPKIMHKIWPVIIQSFRHLDYHSDNYIKNTFNDIIEKWTPHLKISNKTKDVARPFVTCALSDNHDLNVFLFERLANAFLTTQGRRIGPHTCLLIAVLQEVLNAIIADECDEKLTCQRLLNLMKGTLLTILEHTMMVDRLTPSKPLLLTLVKVLVTSTIFVKTRDLQELFIEHLRILAKKHLAYYIFLYFDLLMGLVPFARGYINELMEFLCAEIKVVEAKRGVDADATIRSSLAKLQRALQYPTQIT